MIQKQKSGGGKWEEKVKSFTRNCIKILLQDVCEMFSKTKNITFKVLGWGKGVGELRNIAVWKEMFLGFLKMLADFYKL